MTNKQLIFILLSALVIVIFVSAGVWFTSPERIIVNKVSETSINDVSSGISKIREAIGE